MTATEKASVRAGAARGSARREGVVANLVAYVLLVTGAALFMLPFLYMVSTALKSVDETSEYPPSLIPRKPVTVSLNGRQCPVARLKDGRKVVVLDQGTDAAMLTVVDLALSAGPQAGAAPAQKVAPTELTPVRRFGIHPENFREALTMLPFGQFLKNTLIIVVTTVVGSTLTAALVAYGFARLRFRGRGPLFILLLATMMIPGQVTMIPIYILFKEIGWVDTFLPLIVPAWFGGGAFNIFLLRQFFQQIPYEMEEAARIDGSGPLATWWRIILPLSLPALATVAIFTFMGAWNDFMGPLIYINTTSKYTLALGLSLFRGQYGVDTPHLMMAATLVVLLPVLALFFVAQKHFIQGIVVSGVKG